ncbi:translocation/assembly module TamB domain-containing protein [Bizionia sp.]|uniref:translocation/assembly module TamB domain-containing protein n=1 Tax=Bizionia sp. TaxID=1954480 RepID=UPI003A9150C8
MTIKNTIRKIVHLFSYMLLFLFLMSIVFSIPAVQTRLAKTLTKTLNKEFKTDIVVKQVDLSFLGSVRLKGVEIRDHHKDTLLFVDKLSTSLRDVKKIMDNDVNLGNVSLDGVQFFMTTYKGETDDNLAVFVEKFNTDTPVDSLAPTFLLSTKNIYLNNLTFRISDANNKEPLSLALSDAGGSLSDFRIEGANVYAKLRGLYFNHTTGIEVVDLTTDFTYTTSQMLFENTRIKTAHSLVQANIKFDYNREDLQFFTDKVLIKASIDQSDLAMQDLHKLYEEIDGDDILHFNGDFNGYLNNFKINGFDLVSDEGMKIKSEMSFKNILNADKDFLFDATLTNITANHQQLKSILPNLLGKTLPTELSRLGNFRLSGKTFVSSDKIKANVLINSKLGKARADLELTNIANIDNSDYKGRISLIDFNIGAFINESLFGKVSLDADVNGSGFKLENINTGVIGSIKQLEFNDYVYQNLYVDGLFQNRLFNGNLKVDDAFLKMRFNGLADFSSSVNKFDFTASIEEANLLKTNLFTRDSLSNIKGDIVIDVVGNNFDNIVGRANFKDVVYTNQKQAYVFKNFSVVSGLDKEVKTIKVSSDDIVQGQLNGVFTFNQLLPIAQNALGSMYTNYKPYPVDTDQYIEFDFKIYNQIVDVFFPQIFIGSNTTIRGRLDSKSNDVVFTFISPKVVAYGNEIDELSLRINTTNPLYNTHLMAENIKTKYYDATKLNLINRTQNDTLFFKSEFKGGIQNSETYNMDFYYTFNEDQKFVLGIEKSIFNFKDNVWNINPESNKDNKVVFDFKKEEFVFSPFKLASNEQEITFLGTLRDSTYKDLKINFKKVELSSFLPPIDSLSMYGVLSGDLDFLQKDGVYSPEGNLDVENFKINSFEQGDLKLSVKGNNSYEKYNVDLSLTHNGSQSIFANGDVDFSATRPELKNFIVKLDQFQLNAFSPLGQDILTRLRGEASGEFSVSGFLGNPSMKGEITLKDAGLKFPYLNVDYDFQGITKISLEDQSFNFDQLTLQDVKYGTIGDFSGRISHLNFKDWYLNLKIDTENLLVLDTEDAEETLYYGTAFINGGAHLYGMTSSLQIDVNAKTNPNTVFVLPLSDLKTVDNFSLIRFDSELKTIDPKSQFAVNTPKGLNLNINLEVTKDATAEVVIDKKTGSSLKGNGNGDIQLKIDTRGGFSMYGDFIVDKGKYEFKNSGINRTFEVEKGGTISWNGDPTDANLNVTGIYVAKANPGQLLENFNSNRKIPVNLITRISGGLYNSKQEFDIEIPNVNSAIKSELDFKLNDNNVGEKTKQFLTLLVTNSFYNPNGSGFNSSNAIIGTTSNAISNVLSDLISSSDGKVQFGVGYDVANKSDIDNLNTDDLVNVSVGTQISDRVIINGKVGVPVGSKTQSSVVGEVKVEVLLNEKGNFRGVIFNRQNEIQYSTEEEGYTQGVGLTYQVDFNNLSELLQKMGLKKQRKKQLEQSKDTVVMPTQPKTVKFNPVKKNAQ